MRCGFHGAKVQECLPDYHNKLKAFFEEHIHSDEARPVNLDGRLGNSTRNGHGQEVRYILNGSGYFDVRDREDRAAVMLHCCQLTFLSQQHFLSSHARASISRGACQSMQGWLPSYEHLFRGWTPQDRWIRIALSAGDLIVLPEGIYHRRAVDREGYVV